MLPRKELTLNQLGRPLESSSRMVRKRKPHSLFVSYAQNFEDVLINRFFLGQPGFYIDVGAGDPRRDSVTAGLYRNGWHGINLEPSFRNFRKLKRERRRDLNLRVAAGAERGEVKMTFARNLHESSSTSIISKHLSTRKGSWSESVQVETLDGILEKWFVGQSIDLVKIDVEGSELSVLKGLDLIKWKPRLLLVELVNGHVDISKEIQDFLRQSGYLEAHFDSLNGFFVQAKDLEHASSVFRFGVTYQDNFLNFQHHRLWVWSLGPLRKWIQISLSEFLDSIRGRPTRRSYPK